MEVEEADGVEAAEGKSCDEEAPPVPDLAAFSGEGVSGAGSSSSAASVSRPDRDIHSFAPSPPSSTMPWAAAIEQYSLKLLAPAFA